MMRGEIWTVSGGKDYAGKACPAVILQDEACAATDSVTICAFTTDPTDAPLFRVATTPNDGNGLRASCRLRVDKITTVPRRKIGTRVGHLDERDMQRLDQAGPVFLGLAGAWPDSRRSTTRGDRAP